MYLSRLILNPRSRRVQSEIARRYELHRTIMKAFPEDLPEDERVLFRLEQDRQSGAILLLVQSIGEPDWAHVEAEDDYFVDLVDERNPWVKTYSPKLSTGQVLRFRLQANPTVKRRGKRHGLYKEEEQLDWLRRKGERGGFRVINVWPDKEQMLEGRLFHDKKGHSLKFFSVLFEGTLEVADPDLLLDTLRSGIGSGKAFGFGMLSLAPV